MQPNFETIFDTRVYERALIVKAGANLGRAALGDRGQGQIVNQETSGDVDITVTYAVNGVRLGINNGANGQHVNLDYNPYEWEAWQAGLTNRPIEQPAPYEPYTALRLTGIEVEGFDSFAEFCGVALQDLGIKFDNSTLGRIMNNDDGYTEIHQEVLEGYLASRVLYASMHGLYGYKLAVSAAACGLLSRPASVERVLDSIRSGQTLRPEEFDIYKSAVGLARRAYQASKNSSGFNLACDMNDVAQNSPGLSPNLKTAIGSMVAGIAIAFDCDDTVTFRGWNQQTAEGQELTTEFLKSMEEQINDVGKIQPDPYRTIPFII